MSEGISEFFGDVNDDGLEDQIDIVRQRLYGANLFGEPFGTWDVSESAVGCAVMDWLADLADRSDNHENWFEFLRSALDEAEMRWSAEVQASELLDRARQRRAARKFKK